MNTVQLNLVMDEVRTLLAALEQSKLPPSLERSVRPLEVKLEAAERKLISLEIPRELGPLGEPDISDQTPDRLRRPLKCSDA